MKKLIGFFLGLSLVFLASRSASASEGIVKLNPVGEASGYCYAVSVFEDGMYRILMTCRDLKVSYSADRPYYVLWSENSAGKVARLGEIERGKLSTAVDQPFSGLFVTAESDSYPRKADAVRVMEGKVEEIPFGGERVVQEKPALVVTSTPTPTQSPLIPKTEAKTDDEEMSFSRVFGVIGRVVGLGILILIVAGVVLTIVTRRKEA